MSQRFQHFTLVTQGCNPILILTTDVSSSCAPKSNARNFTIVNGQQLQKFINCGIKLLTINIIWSVFKPNTILLKSMFLIYHFYHCTNISLPIFVFKLFWEGTMIWIKSSELSRKHNINSSFFMKLKTARLARKSIKLLHGKSLKLFTNVSNYSIPSNYLSYMSRISGTFIFFLLKKSIHLLLIFRSF